MAENVELIQLLQKHVGTSIVDHSLDDHQLTVEILASAVCQTCLTLRDLPVFQFNMLIDLCGVDYLHYGLDEWKKDSATLSGFSRGVMSRPQQVPVALKPRARFAVIYHLLSTTLNHRIRLKVYLPEEDPPVLDSVIQIWQSANWYEREAFDLYGILFKNHPDLRRLLTDYGFIGHPFRKDFPLIGNLEMRYDATRERCVYEPVRIISRTLVPKVIREDHRYLVTEEEAVHG